MKTKLVLIAAVFAALISSAQTNEPIVQVKFYSDPNATNQIIFLQKGPVRSIRGVVKGTFPQSGRILVSTMLPSKYENGFPIFDENGYQKWEESGNQIILANYPALEILTTGQTIDFAARKIGTIRGLKSDGTDSSRVLELWEYYTPPQPTPEQIAAVKEAARLKTERERQKYLLGETNAVRWLLSQATNGDSSAQCDLGEHYLAGLGCETNREQGIYWLQQAAAQGYVEASNKLTTLQK